MSYAGVVELVDTPDLGSGIERCGGSSPSTRTIILKPCKFALAGFFCGFKKVI